MNTDFAASLTDFYLYLVSSQKVGAILPNPKGFENL
jgi:hypothetical protein